MKGSILNKKLLLYFMILIIGFLIFVIHCLNNNNEINKYDDDILVINGYKLRYISASNICIGFVNDDTTMYFETYIKPHIYQYCYNERFIGIKQVKKSLKKNLWIQQIPNITLLTHVETLNTNLTQQMSMKCI
jgi:hypothetical protein